MTLQGGMKFEVSDEHVRRTQRRQRGLAGAMAVLAAAGVAMAMGGQPVWGLAVAAFGAHAAWSAWKSSRSGACTWPVVEALEEPARLAVAYKDMMVTIVLSDAVRLRLQRRRGRLVSVLLETAAGQRLRIEGYDHQDQLADWLQRHVPAQRVMTAHWYHR